MLDIKLYPVGSTLAVASFFFITACNTIKLNIVSHLFQEEDLFNYYRSQDKEQINQDVSVSIIRRHESRPYGSGRKAYIPYMCVCSFLEIC